MRLKVYWEKLDAECVQKINFGWASVSTALEQKGWLFPCVTVELLNTVTCFCHGLGRQAWLLRGKQKQNSTNAVCLKSADLSTVIQKKTKKKTHIDH